MAARITLFFSMEAAMRYGYYEARVPDDDLPEGKIVHYSGMCQDFYTKDKDGREFYRDGFSAVAWRDKEKVWRGRASNMKDIRHVPKESFMPSPPA